MPLAKNIHHLPQAALVHGQPGAAAPAGPQRGQAQALLSGTCRCPAPPGFAAAGARLAPGGARCPGVPRLLRAGRAGWVRGAACEPLLPPGLCAEECDVWVGTGWRMGFCAVPQF